jgi:hypothetical protein
MHNFFILGVEIICATIILFRAIQVGARLDWHKWSGHPLQFVGYSLAYPLLAGGALGILLDRNGGFLLLLVGIMFQLLSERRRTR